MDEIKRKRAAARGWFTRAFNNLTTATEHPDSDRVDLEEGIAELNKRLETLEEVQTQVETLIEDFTELETEIREAGEQYDAAIKLRKKATRILSRLTKEDDDEMSSMSTSSKRLAKLPKIELPKFKGDVTQFKEFWDQFSATIDSSDLPVVTKFTYLKSLLEGDAKSAIDGLTLTQEHYTVACDILQERFGRTELIVFSHIQSLLNLKPDEKQKSAVAKLRSLMDQLNIHVRCL